MDFLADPPPQQLQFGPWLERLGLSALRSFVSNAWRRPESIAANLGAVSNTRGASVPQAVQVHGSENFDMGAMASNGPQVLHQYS